MNEHSFKLNLEDAVRLGFAPGAFASPLQVHHYVDMNRLSFTRYIIVGLDASYSKFKVSKELYRDNGKMLRSSGDKVLKIVGNIYDLTQLEQILSRPCDDEASTVPYEAIRTMLVDVIGKEITGNKTLPTSFSVINSILGHIRENRKDHARLLYHWPIFFDHFKDNPSVLDRAVKGDSLWDALEEFYPKSTIDAARKIKFFSFTWNNLGVSLMNYLKYILFVMDCQPKGAPGPQNEAEAQLLNRMGHNFISTFNGFNDGAEIALRAFFADKNWRNHSDIQRGYVYHRSDYTRFLRDNLIREIRPEITDEQAVKIIMAMHGNKVDLISNASNAWHWELHHFNSVERRYKLPMEWPAPFETVKVPEDIVPGGLVILSLHSREMLSVEGDAQRHCVAYHDKRCGNGQARVISIRQGKERLSTAAILKDGDKLVYEQHRGFANHTPSGETISAATWFLDEINKGGIEFSRNWPNLVKVTETNVEPETLREHYAVFQHSLAKKYREGGFVAFEKLCHTVT